MKQPYDIYAFHGEIHETRYQQAQVPSSKDFCKANQACPNDALTYKTDENERLGGKIVVDEVLCNECN